MPTHQMPAEAVADAQGALEVDRRADRERAQRGERQGFGGDIGLEPGTGRVAGGLGCAGIEGDHRQAGAVAGDRLAHQHIVEGQRTNGEAQAHTPPSGARARRRPTAWISPVNIAGSAEASRGL